MKLNTKSAERILVKLKHTNNQFITPNDRHTQNTFNPDNCYADKKAWQKLLLI